MVFHGIFGGKRSGEAYLDRSGRWCIFHHFSAFLQNPMGLFGDVRQIAEEWWPRLPPMRRNRMDRPGFSQDARWSGRNQGSWGEFFAEKRGVEYTEATLQYTEVLYMIYIYIYIIIHKVSTGSTWCSLNVSSTKVHNVEDTAYSSYI